MSFLYPGALAAGALVGYIVILHLVRRQNLIRMPFSSLMFLRPTAARANGPRRLEDLLLLILRALALVLLAAGFARPFIPTKPHVQSAQSPGRRIVLLLDTSGSMRRTGLWEQALSHARSIIESRQPEDRLGLITFDQAPKTLLDLQGWVQMAPEQAKTFTLDLLSVYRPGWSRTRMDLAIMSALELVEADSDYIGSPSGIASELVIISDMQFPPEALEGLQGLDWPKDIKVLPIPLTPKGQTNATLQLADDDGSIDQPKGLRVKVSNAPSSRQDRFRIRWSEDVHAQVMDVYVQPGESTVLEIPTRPFVGRITLEGDDHDFDNSLFVVPQKDRSNVVYIGQSDPTDPQKDLFYLKKALGASNRPLVMMDPGSIADADLNTAAMVVSGPGQYLDLGPLARYVQTGGLVLVMAQDPSAAGMLIQGITGLPGLPCKKVDMDQTYAMITRLETGHSILAEFVQPRFSNFTQIHIWRYIKFDISNIEGCKTLMWLDTGDPAMFELACGKGAIIVLTFAWNLPDSDLALSSKFVPLLYGLLDYAIQLSGFPTQYYIGQALPSLERPAIVIRPDGSRMQLSPGQAFTQTDLPGIYTLISDQVEQAFAVNIWPDEALAWPPVTDQIGAMGISVSHKQEPTLAVNRPDQRHHWQAVESGQGLWRWPLLAGALILLIETILAAIGQGKEDVL